jgi:hypothetical protein
MPSCNLSYRGTRQQLRHHDYTRCTYMYMYVPTHWLRIHSEENIVFGLHERVYEDCVWGKELSN